MTEPIKLPPLPEGLVTYEFPDGAYDKEGMQAYARAAIEADRQARGEPVAWWKIFEGKVSVVPADTFLHEDANAAGWRALVFQDAPQPQQIPEGYKLVPVEPPTNCRQRLAKEGKPYPRSSCFVCGKLSPRHRECDAMLEAAPEPKGKS